MVSAIPSISAAGASVVPSKTTTTPWTRGSPPIVTSLTATWPLTSEGIRISSPCSSATKLARRVGLGVEAVVSAASSASIATTGVRLVRDVLGGEIGEVHEPLTVD